MTDGNESSGKNGPDATVSGSGAPRPAGSTLLPESIGGYRVLGKLGEGGMGIVFLAEQPSPRREVAVKVIRGGRLVGEHQIHLFHREAESLARLKHPGIAAIYEAGLTEDGSHFFAMELVRGETLEAHIERGPWPLSKEEVVRRLRLFLEICDAVHYAHQRGVIHRDLKPGNVIVNEEGSIKILDFGLARITDSDIEATATALGTIRGTLAYMSPEQARGDPAEIDLRTDVYSLGVILYEALSGARPIEIETKSLVDALRKISEERPRPLREVWMGAARLDPDLETILGKAIEKEPDRRYASAAALAEDVERYLTSQPIQARPPSAWYHARKFAARNRVLVAGAVATALALVGGAVVSTVFGLREAAQRREAERARADVETVADFQARMLSGVNPETTGLGIARAAREVLGSALASRGRPDEEIDAALSSLDAALRAVSPTDVARRVLHENVLAPAAEAAAAEFGGRPALEARLLETIARTYRGLGMASEGEPHARRALALRRETGGEADRATLEASRLLGNTLVDIGRFDEAASLLESALERLRGLAGSEDPATLGAAHEVALLEFRRGRNELAEAMLAETLEAHTRVLGPRNEATINVTNTRAGVLFRLGRYDEAERLWSEVVDRRREILGRDDPQTLGAISNLALARMSLGRLEEADTLFRDAHRSYVRTLGEAHPTTIRVLFNRAIVAQRRGRPEEAETFYREALSVRERSRGPDHPDTLNARNDLGVFLTGAGRLDEAREVLTNLVRRAGRALGPDSIYRAQFVHSYAELLLARNEFAEAEERLQEAIDAYERVGSRHLGLARYQTALLAARRGDRASTLSRLRSAIEAGHARERILDDAAFARYREDPEFEALLIPSSSKSASR